MDLLSEILDSLSTGPTRTGSLRPSQSLDCCHRGDLDSCLSLVSPPVLPHLSITRQPIPHLKSSNLLISPPPPSPTYQEDQDGSQTRRTPQSPSPSPCRPACHICKHSSLRIPRAPQRTSLPSHPQRPVKKSLLHPSLQQLQTQATKGPLNPLSQSPIIESNISPLLMKQPEIPEPRRAPAPSS